MIYLLLFAGLFMGWSLGTNDAANAFGTAVATRVISYRTAVIIIAVLVIVGAFVGGAGNIDSVAKLSTSNKVTASVEEVTAIVAQNDQSLIDDLVLKSALKAAIIFTCAALTVFMMSSLKMPVSANQSIILSNLRSNSSISRYSEVIGRYFGPTCLPLISSIPPLIA